MGSFNFGIGFLLVAVAGLTLSAAAQGPPVPAPGEGSAANGTECDANNRCPEGESCVVLPGEGPTCVSGDACETAACPSGTECVMAESFPPQVTCQCTGDDCPRNPDAGEPVSYTPSGRVSFGDTQVTNWRAADNSSGMLETPSYSVPYRGKVRVDGSRMVVDTPTGTREIGVSPEEAVENAGEGDVEEVRLKSKDDEPRYEVRTSRKAKLLGVIGVRMGVRTEVNAETGDVEKVKRPWWAFAAS